VKGIYLLLINMERNSKIKIGSLGFRRFKEGNYAYAGSAQNGIDSRILRHLSQKKKKHWHIDYLLACKSAKVTSIFYKRGPKSEECILARKASLAGTPVAGFGCSDCKCDAHLYRIINLKKLRE
jgi:Uri superfamily endonuclease